MEKGSKSGRMDQNMRATGAMAEHKVQENSSTQIMISIKVSSWKIKPMVTGFINMSTARVTKGFSKMIFNMEKASRY